MPKLLKYALIAASGAIVAQLVRYFAGLSTNSYIFFLGFLTLMFAIHHALITLRREQGFLRFRQGLTTGVMISLFCGMIAGGYQALHVTVIEPGYQEAVKDELMRNTDTELLSEEELAELDQAYTFAAGPGGQFLVQSVNSIFSGLMISFFLGLVLQRQPSLPE